jgi:hypothetical protein
MPQLYIFAPADVDASRQAIAEMGYIPSTRNSLPPLLRKDHISFSVPVSPNPQQLRAAGVSSDEEAAQIRSYILFEDRSPHALVISDRLRASLSLEGVTALDDLIERLGCDLVVVDFLGNRLRVSCYDTDHPDYD